MFFGSSFNNRKTCHYNYLLLPLVNDSWEVSDCDNIREMCIID